MAFGKNILLPRQFRAPVLGVILWRSLVILQFILFYSTYYRVISSIIIRFCFCISLRQKHNVLSKVLLTAVYAVTTGVIKTLLNVWTVGLSLPGIHKGYGCAFNYTLRGHQLIGQDQVEVSAQTCTEIQHWVTGCFSLNLELLLRITQSQISQILKVSRFVLLPMCYNGNNTVIILPTSWILIHDKHTPQVLVWKLWSKVM